MTPQELGTLWCRSTEISAVTDGAGPLAECNPAAEHAGFRAGQSLEAIADVPSRQQLARMTRRAISGHVAVGEVVLTPGDIAHTYLLTAVPLGSGRIAWTGRDVTLERIRDAALRGAVGHDALTGLPDRATWRDRLEQALKRAARTDAGIGMMFIDLDDFKTINDQHGHSFGDQVLIEVGQRIRSVLRQEDTLARLGGDEFIILCEELPGVAELAKLGERVSGAVSQRPVVALGQSALVSCSVGVTYAHAGEMDPELFIRTADNAMYSAKRRGPGQTVAAQFARTSDRMMLGIQRAIDAGTLPMGLQPIVDAHSGQERGRAVDVRLGNRRHAASALRTLEANPATMRSLASLALRQAIAVLQREPDTTVQVRVPMVAFTDHDFLRSMHRQMVDAGIDPDRVVLAVDAAGARSERALMHAKEAVEFPLPLALTRFGLNSVDIGALSELEPQVCELDPSFGDPGGGRSRTHMDAACELAHTVGARTQLPAHALATGAPPAAIDQVRKLPGKTLQPLAQVPIGR